MDSNKTLVYIIGFICAMIAGMMTVASVTDSKNQREQEKTKQSIERTRQMSVAWKIDSAAAASGEAKYQWKSDSINGINPCE